MDRELVLSGMMMLICGPLIWLSGLVPASARTLGCGRQLEYRTWRALWLPLLPAVIVVAALLGWAVQEPARSDETFTPTALGLGTWFALVWARAIVRAVLAAWPRTYRFPAATVGLLAPRIIIDPRLRAVLDADALTAAVAHEAAHARHRDPLRIWLAQLATDLQWPWPAAHRRLRAWTCALELARDDEARESGTDGADLAAAILAAARLAGDPPGDAVACLHGDAAVLGERVRRLLADPPDGFRVRRRGKLAWLLLAACAIAFVVGYIDGESLVRFLPGVAS